MNKNLYSQSYNKVILKTVLFSESGSINSIKSCSQFKVLVQETVFIILRHFKDKPYVEMSHTIAGLDKISRVDFIVISNLLR